MRSKKSHPAEKAFVATCLALLLMLAITAQPAQSQTFKVLHTFHGPNGYGPAGVLTRDSVGDLYGTTIAGGTGRCGKYGCGTAFKLNKAGKQVWLHSFQGPNGNGPNAGLLRDGAGNLFGTTVEGGDTGCFSLGCGTVFKLDKTGKEKVLHKFTCVPDGDSPEALLVQDSAGTLYGTTYLGGAHGFGTVFKMSKSGKEETELYSFGSAPDGAAPYPGVILDAAGNLYGVTFDGGTGTECDFGCGTVFRIDATGNETILHNFDGGQDGAAPASLLLFDSDGNLYGATTAGGSSECGGTGCGTVFELSSNSDGTWTETVLYAFCSRSGCADGERPVYGPLVRDAKGNMYGTTVFGGTSQGGVVFELDTTGKETVLHNFTGGSDGAGPVAGLIMDQTDVLYGVTEIGGDNVCQPPYGCGVVFMIRPFRP